MRAFRYATLFLLLPLLLAGTRTVVGGAGGFQTKTGITKPIPNPPRNISFGLIQSSTDGYISADFCFFVPGDRSCEFLFLPTTDSAAAGCPSSGWQSNSDFVFSMPSSDSACDYLIYTRDNGGRQGITAPAGPVRIETDNEAPPVPGWHIEPTVTVVGIFLYPTEVEDPQRSIPVEYRIVCNSGLCATTAWDQWGTLAALYVPGGAGTHCYSVQARDALQNTSALSEEKCVTTS